MVYHHTTIAKHSATPTSREYCIEENVIDRQMSGQKDILDERWLALKLEPWLSAAAVPHFSSSCSKRNLVDSDEENRLVEHPTLQQDANIGVSRENALLLCCASGLK